MSDAEQAVILERLLVRERRVRIGSWIKWLAQVTLLLGLAWAISLFKQPVPSLSVWDFQEPARVLGLVQTAAGHFAIQGLIFFLLGLLVPVVLRGRQRATPRRQGEQTLVVKARKSRSQPVPPDGTFHRGRLFSLARFFALVCVHAVLAIVAFSAVVAVALIGALVVLSSVGMSTALDVGSAMAGAGAGIWSGWWASRGWIGVRPLAVQSLSVVVFLIVGGMWLRTQLLQPQPFDIAPLVVTSADKRQLVELLKQQSDDRDGQRIYHVTADQLDKLLAWWIAFASPESKAKVELTDAGQKVAASLRLPARLGSRPYLNLAAEGRCAIAEERLDLNAQAAQIGSITIPGWVMQRLSEYLARWINDDPVNRDLLVGVSAALTHEGGADVCVTEAGLHRRRWAKAIREWNGRPDVSIAVAEHLTEFAEIVAAAKRKEPLFAPVVRTAFEKASGREASRDPIEANRAAILALGIALGHHSLEPYVGELWQDVGVGSIARIPGRSTLRGRADWSRHFWVSAAVALLASERVSDELGRLKEELDAGKGGSGYSFGDLAADRAGIAFARVATRDAQSAPAVQQWILSPDTDLNDLMPEAGDLAEGLSDADMLERFDGVGGVRYKQAVADIDQRITALPWHALPCND